MKTIKILLNSILAVILFISTACSDFLEVTPPDELRIENSIVNLMTARSALYAGYDRMQDNLYYGTDFISWGEVRGDDMGTTYNGNRTMSQYQYGHLTPLNYSWDFWSYQYASLNYMNALIIAIDGGKVVVAASEKEALDDIKGQALALRALFHFDVVRLHGEPYLKNKAAPGAVVTKKVIQASETPQRSTVEQTYTAIIQDLNDAIPLLSAAKTKNIINRWAAKAMLARVYLYQGNWELAYENAKDVVDNGGYSLIANDRYVESWALESTSESIFELSNTDIDNADRECIGYVMHPGGYGAMSTTPAFIALMDEDPDDVRWGILKTNNQDFEGGYVAKYPGREGNIYVNNIRIVRLSDVYLMAAEAGILAGKAESEYSHYLNDIRKRANPALADVTPTLELVEKERRKELVGEGHRFFDITRNLGANTVTRAGTSSLPIRSIDVPVISWNNADTYRLILPIPNAEVEVNPDILQNAGYTNVN